MSTDPLTTSDKERLQLFRGVASQVRFSSVVDGARRISIDGRIRPSGEMTTSVNLLEEEPFRSLATSVRLAYQPGEPANFYSIANILARIGSDDVRVRVAELRRGYTAALGAAPGAMSVVVDGEVQALSAKDVFETWMYTGVFHQDPDRLPTCQALRTRPDWFLFSVQMTALLLCGRIMDLDDVIADLLGEERMARIPAAPGDTQ